MFMLSQLSALVTRADVDSLLDKMLVTISFKGENIFAVKMCHPYSLSESEGQLQNLNNI